MTIEAQEELDARGLHCPEPLLLVRNRVRKMSGGGILHVRATDPSTERDLAQFCQFLGHVMLQCSESQGVYEFWIQKSAS
ncbi:MAG: sulfurtransferase TusA [Gammaproteobacteria bacterium]|nr:sulfurtransferase TusA [Gammaproteobacteria bacterium]